MICTGKEERLLDCTFPQDFGEASASDYESYTYDYEGNRVPDEAPLGTSGGCRRVESDRLAVLCRKFEIPGAGTLPSERAWRYRHSQPALTYGSAICTIV